MIWLLQLWMGGTMNRNIDLKLAESIMSSTWWKGLLASTVKYLK